MGTINLFAKENKHWFQIAITLFINIAFALIAYGRISEGVSIIFSEQKEQKMMSEERWKEQGIKNDKFSEAMLEAAANQKDVAKLIVDIQDRQNKFDANQIIVMKKLNIPPYEWRHMEKSASIPFPK
jgi:hypothetical protein